MSLNKAILIGNVGRDPDIKYFDNGNSQANFTLATNERGYTLANGTQIPERTDWHNIVIRRDQVPFVEKYVKKGSSVMVEGKIRYRDYEKDGIKRYVTEIIADKIEFFNSGRRPDGTGNTNSQETTTQNTAIPQAAPFNESEENPTDDLPF